MSSPYLIGELDKISSDDGQLNCVGLVLDVYTAIVASSRSERSAFDAAVETYRTHNPDLPEKDARLAVARIICWKS